MLTVKKNFLIKTLFMLLGLAPFFYPVNSPASEDIKVEDLTVVALGDSITWGYPNGQSWTSMVSDATGMRIINRGINGNTLDGMKNRLASDVLVVKLAICIIMGGTNDVYRGYTSARMMENIQAMVNDLVDQDIFPVIGLPIPLAEQGPEGRLQDLRNRINSTGLITIDFSVDFDLPRDEYRKLIYDGIHPSIEGKRLMAARLKKELPRILSAYSRFRK
jgi:acyl-CoA thioesterase I